MGINADALQQTLENHQAEINLLRLFVFALLEQLPVEKTNEVLVRLRSGVEDAVASAPVGTHPDTIVELRAHAEFYYAELAARSNPRAS